MLIRLTKFILSTLPCIDWPIHFIINIYQVSLIIFKGCFFITTHIVAVILRTTTKQDKDEVNCQDVMTPPMVGSTWPRVRSTLGLDCLPTLSQGTALLLRLFLDLLIAIFILLRAHVRCPMSSDLGVVLVRFIYLLIMRVGARSHGTLYPMTGCVLYLGGLLCW